jgi:deazaflavin-dependent oxidoreductase (nitroreductase family)
VSDFENFNQQMIDQFRANGGRLEFGPASLTLLTTTGAKTGRRHLTPLAAYQEDGHLYVIASMGGSPRNPAWYHNLVAHPSVTVEHAGDTYEATAKVVSAQERDALFDRIVEQMPQFGEYQKNTTRVIPVIELARST